MIRFVQIALLLGIVSVVASWQFGDKEPTFNKCRADWIATFRPNLGVGFEAKLVDSQYMSACMAANNFMPEYTEHCSYVLAVTSSSCYRKRMPWQ